MKKGLFLSTSCILVLSLSACGPRWDTGNIITEQKQVAHFNAIDISAPLDVTITVKPGAATSVSFKGFPDELKKLRTEVRGNVLHIFTEEKHWSLDFDEEPKAEIIVGSLSALTISGAAEVETKGNISGDAFTLVVAGAGDVKIAELNTSKITIDAAGAADVKIKKGNAKEAEYDFSGAGDLDAYGLNSDIVDASVAGAGDLKVRVSQTLSASISGVGNISYKGSPTVNKDVSGVGSVSDAN